jgi:hypothetical protein
MGKNKIVEALRSAKAGGDLPKVDPESLETLMKLKEEALMLSMEAQEADLVFRRKVAEVCRDAGAPIDRSIVCLSCGLIRPIQHESCPHCSG